MKKLFALVAVIVTCVACDKKQPAVTSSVEVTPDSPYTVSTSTVFSGIFTSADGDLTAVFSNTPSANFSSDPLRVNRVICNGNTFVYENDWQCYRCPVSDNLGTQILSVEGFGTIPSFNYTNKDNTPSCNTAFTFPDSISKSTGFTIQINSVNNVTPTGFDIVLINPSGPPNTIYKAINNGNNTITFTPSELSVFSNGNLYLVITLENSKALNFYGKDFKFTKRRSFSKLIKITN